MPTTPYVVRQGDTLISIAARVGCDADAIWEDPANATLKQDRSDPSILCPGDVLYVPVVPPVVHSVSVGSTNAFMAKIPTQPLKLVISGEKPLANEPYVVKGLGDDIQGTTDGDGTLTLDVPVTATSFNLELTNRGIVHPVLVGHLDPISESSGMQQRLSNLGYGSIIAPIAASLGVHTGFGVEQQILAFQIDEEIDLTGDVSDDTVKALQDAHGT